MNKEELIAEVAKITCTKSEAGKAVDALFEGVKKGVEKRRKSDTGRFWNFFRCEKVCQNGKKSPDRQTDQDRGQESAQVCRRQSIKKRREIICSFEAKSMQTVRPGHIHRR